MTQKRYLESVLFAGYILLSLVGFLFHLRVHPPSEGEVTQIVPFISGIISLLVIPALFLFSKTAAYAYVLNGMLVIVGTITMAHLSIANLPQIITFQWIVTGSMLANILAAWVKFFIGQALFELSFLKDETTPARKGRYFRYPNMGWWWVHLAGLSVVYALGNILWK